MITKITEEDNLFLNWGANLKKCFRIVESSVSIDNKALNDFYVKDLRDHILKNFYLTKMENEKKEKLIEFFEFLFNFLIDALNGFDLSIILKSR
jgi:hypothetical protein